MVMQLAYELHIDEEEILTWHKDKFVRWMAFFKIRQENEKKAAERSKRKVGKARGPLANVANS